MSVSDSSTIPPSPADPGTPDGHVSADVRDGVATITFGHPKGNAMPGALLRALAADIERAGRDESARVVVLRSEGDGPFCAGASFDEVVAISASGDAAAGQRFFSGFAAVILAMLRCPKFVVARVHGKAAGGGVGLVAASDYAIATTRASCRLSELAIGFGPFVIGPVIERKIGSAAFGAMAVDADWRDAAWARERGLFTQVVDDVGALDREVSTLATRLSGFNPDAMAELKRVLWAGTDGWDALLAERAAISGRLMLSEHTRRAIAAFKRG